MQRKHEKTDVYRAIVNMEEQATLKRGTIVARPYRSALVVNDLGADGSYSTQAITDAEETLTINKEKEVSFYIRSIDELQSNYKTTNLYADDAAVKLGNQIDGDVLGEYDQASNTVDDADVSNGTALNGIVASPSNILKIFSAARRKLMHANVQMNNLFAIISPELEEHLLTYLASKDTPLGDNQNLNGMITKQFKFDIYGSNALGWSAKLLIGTVPTVGDTVTINGAVFTFADTGNVDTAGEVYYGLSASAAITNLVASINTPGTTDAGIFVALSAANQALLKNIVATAVSGGLTLKATGKGYVVVSETLTAPADVWTQALQIQHNLFGRKGAIDLVIQKYPEMEIKDVSGKLGKDVVSHTVYGKKTFSEGTVELVDVKVRSDAF